MPTIRELYEHEFHLGYPAMLELRPHLESVETFVRSVTQDQIPEGYRLIASFDDDTDVPAAVAGFRTGHSLGWGYFLYVDDMVTRTAFRGSGHAARLMKWIYEEAARLGCDQVHLDSGVQRYDAHRLYLSQHMKIVGHHFFSGSNEKALTG